MSKDMLMKIKDAGIVGAGGAGFPTHVKVASPAKTIIVNCPGCDKSLILISSAPAPNKFNKSSCERWT